MLKSKNPNPAEINRVQRDDLVLLFDTFSLSVWFGFNPRLEVRSFLLSWIRQQNVYYLKRNWIICLCASLCFYNIVQKQNFPVFHPINRQINWSVSEWEAEPSPDPWTPGSGLWTPPCRTAAPSETRTPPAPCAGSERTPGTCKQETGSSWRIYDIIDTEKQN